MEKRQLFLIITLLLCTKTQIRAQWETSVSQPWVVKNYYNPSFVGHLDNINTTALYRYQQANKNDAVPHANQRVIITCDMPFLFMQRNHGAGIVVYTENYGSLRNSLLATQYSYKQSIANGMLNVGIQAGIYNLNYYSGTTNINSDTPQNNNQQIRVEMTGIQVADIGAGVSWTDKRFYAGFSIMHLNQPGFKIESNNNKTNTNTSPEMVNGNSKVIDSLRSFIPRTFNFITGYNIPLFNSLEIQPMLWILTDNNQTQIQTIIRMEYNNKLSGGISIVSKNRHSIFIGTTIQGLNLGYAYTNRSHELYLKYNFALNNLKPKTQPHKSIRIL